MPLGGHQERNDNYPDSQYLLCGSTIPHRPVQKKSLFPVQRMAVIVTSRAAAYSFFFLKFSLFSRKILSISLKKKYPFILVTWPLHQKHNFILAWPRAYMGVDGQVDSIWESILSIY